MTACFSAGLLAFPVVAVYGAPGGAPARSSLALMDCMGLVPGRETRLCFIVRGGAIAVVEVDEEVVVVVEEKKAVL